MMDKRNSKKPAKKRIKREIFDSSGNSGAFFLQKYEIVIMLLGAGVISMLIFFVFLKPSGDRNFFNTKTSTDNVSVKEFKNQIDRLENIVQKAGLKDPENIENKEDNKKDKVTSKNETANRVYDDYEKKIERIEASFSIKYATLLNRINKLERNIDRLSSRIDSNKNKTTSLKKVVKQPSVKTSKKKETKKEVDKKKQSIFHTVKKGETLYSLSKKYNTPVSQLEKLNHLPKNANIYPGDNLLVR